MKKIFLSKGIVMAAIVAIMTMFASCQNDEVISHENVEQKNLIDYDVTKLSYEQTEAELQLAKEAYNIMDKYVSLQDGKFVLSTKDGKSIGLSERVFDYYRNRLQGTNELLSAKGVITKQVGQKSVELYTGNYNFSDTRAAGGITKLILSWGSFDLYISNSDCRAISRGTGVLAVLSISIPDPSISKISAIVLGLCNIGFGYLADTYSTGVIISCDIIPVPVIGCYNSWSVNGQ